MKKTIVFAGLMLLTAMLTGCGTKSEKEIKNDIVSTYDFFIENADLEVKDIEIMERKTDSDNKTDEIKVSVTAQNSVFKYKGEFQLEYYLYDQGWTVEELNQTGYDLEPLTTNITSEMAYGMLDHAFMIDIWDFAFYVQDDFVFDSENVDLENDLHEFIFKSNDGKQKLLVIYKFTRDGNSCDWRYQETKKASN